MNRAARENLNREKGTQSDQEDRIIVLHCHVKKWRSLIQTQQCHVGNRINTQRGGIRTLQKQNAHKHKRRRVEARVDKKSHSLFLSHTHSFFPDWRKVMFRQLLARKALENLGGPTLHPRTLWTPLVDTFQVEGRPIECVNYSWQGCFDCHADVRRPVTFILLMTLAGEVWEKARRSFFFIFHSNRVSQITEHIIIIKS